MTLARHRRRSKAQSLGGFHPAHRRPQLHGGMSATVTRPERTAGRTWHGLPAAIELRDPVRPLLKMTTGIRSTTPPQQGARPRPPHAGVHHQGGQPHERKGRPDPVTVPEGTGTSHHAAAPRHPPCIQPGRGRGAGPRPRADQARPQAAWNGTRGAAVPRVDPHRRKPPPGRQGPAAADPSWREPDPAQGSPDPSRWPPDPPEKRRRKLTMVEEGEGERGGETAAGTVVRAAVGRRCRTPRGGDDGRREAPGGGGRGRCSDRPRGAFGGRGGGFTCPQLLIVRFFCGKKSK
jgi:hypothetical protein